MRKFFNAVAKFFAIVLCLLFVITMVLALLLTSIDRRLMTPTIYKEALTEQQVYARIPRIIAEQVVVSMNYNPCEANPLLCEGASVEFTDCAKRTFGEERFNVLANGAENPTQAEIQLLQPCIEQFGMNLVPQQVVFGDGQNPLPSAPQAVQDCTKQAIGVDVYNAIFSNQRQPNENEKNAILACYDQAGIPTQSSESPPPYIRNLTVSDWENIITTVISSQDIKAMSEDLLDQIFAYFNGQIDTVTIPLIQLRERIAGPQGLNALIQVIRVQQPCTDAEVSQINSAIEHSGGSLVMCRPPEDVLTRMTPILEEQMRAAAQQIPDQAVILNPDTFRNPDNPAPASGPMAGFRLIRFIMRLSVDIPLGLLLLITLLVVRAPKSWLRWWGIPVFCSGLVAVAITMILSSVLENAWIDLLANRIPLYLSLGLVQLIYDLTSYIVHSLLEAIAARGAILLLIGLGAWIGSIFIKNREVLPVVDSPAPPPPV